MEQSGLSSRGTANVEAIWPRISHAVAERALKEEIPRIDMGTSENWLMRPELIEQYKAAVQHGLSNRVSGPHTSNADPTTKRISAFLTFRQHLSYPDGFNGDQALLEALVNFFNTYFSPFIPITKAHLATAPGAAFSLDSILYNICDPGDGLMVMTPCWNGFDWLIKARSSVQPVYISLESIDDALRTKPLILALENALSQSIIPIRGLLFTNPHNPLGQCYPKTSIMDIIEFCNKHKIHFISDEIYAMSAITDPDVVSPTPFVSALQLDIQGMGCDLSRVHTIWSTSKDLGSNGLRMGCCITQGNKKLATGLSIVSNTQMSSLTALVTTHLLNSADLPRLFALNSERLGKACETVISVLKSHNIPYIPVNMGPFILIRLLSDARTWEEEDGIVQACKSAGVIVSAGRGFHLPESEKGWVRLNFAIQPDRLVEALQRVVRGRDEYLKHVAPSGSLPTTVKS